MKLKELCPDWNECLENCWAEFEFETREEAENFLAYNNCCGCIQCVLLRKQVGCGDNCWIRERYPQYRNDEEMFSLSVGFDPEEILDELREQYGYEPTIEDVFEEGIKQQIQREKVLRKAMKKEASP